MKLLIAFLLALFSVVCSAPADFDFDRQISPLLAEKCLSCHNQREPKGGLDLTTKMSAFSGGDSGAVLVPGKLGESYLWDRVASDEMPPKHPLSAEQKQLLKTWIETGAPWTGDIDPFAYSTENRAGYDWWALQPLQKTGPPQREDNPIDAFVKAKLSQQNLSPSQAADGRTLIRRLSFDLLGLPPTYDQVQEFVNNPSADANAELVDRMLASPHYGERWARHWLDLARFGESQGFERDKLRDNAWPYRDWVIEALNEDMPFDQFARMQIAGDILQPGDAHALTATGFLVAGPYDEVGQNQQSAVMRAVVRQDEMEDYIGTVCQTFLGLTVNCARCHDHKFDPITQTEYYQISSALSGVRAGERPYQTAEMQQQLVAAEAKQSVIKKQIEELLAPIRQRLMTERGATAEQAEVVQPMTRWTFDTDAKDDLGNLESTLHGGAKIVDGQLQLNGSDAYLSTSPLPVSLKAKTLEAWVQLDNLAQRGGGVVSLQTTNGVLFDAIVFGEKDPGQWVAGSNNFARTQSFQAMPDQEADKQLVHVAIVYQEDGLIQGYRNGEAYGQPYKSSGPLTFPAGESQIILGLRHGTGAGGNRMLAGRIEQAQLYDRALSAEEIAITSARFNVLSKVHLVAELKAEQKNQLEKWEKDVADLSQQISSLRSRRVYAVTPRQPSVTQVLLRGNPATPDEEVAAAGIKAIKGISPDFGLSKDAPEAERRKKFADWIASADNPLFARVIVNRLWHYHFGQGIVGSPNDFGFNGSRPTHPELLDFLANYLIENKWSLKAVHRLIVTSQTYQQSSKSLESAMEVDADNRWLWRYSPQRLQAEVVRDTMLKVSGVLNTKFGGPSYRNFETFTRNSQFYIMQDRPEPEFQRRTVYRMWVRSGRNQLLDALDCPDPSVTTPVRAVTTTPTQSLSLLNNSFVLRMSDELTDRITKLAPEEPTRQVALAYQFALQRDPAPEESEPATEFVSEHGLVALIRVLFNTNEFLFVE